MSYVYSLATDFGGALNLERLGQEIRASAIVTALDYVTQTGDAVEVVFKAALSAGDKTTLDGDSSPAGGLVAAHDSAPSVRQPDAVIIQEEDVATPTNGKIQNTSIQFVADAEATTLYDVPPWPHPIAATLIEFVTEAAHLGDTVELLVAVDTVVGAITSDVAQGATVIAVQPSVVNNVYPGDRLKLYNGSASADLGYISAVDKAAKTVTVGTPAAQAFSAATPTYCLYTSVPIKSRTVGPAWRNTVGESKIGSSYLPANVPIRVVWHNYTPIETVGYLAADVGAGATVLGVDAAALARLVRGDKVDLYDGVNADAGIVLRVDRDAAQITVASATQHAFAAATPTRLRLVGKRVNGMVEYLR